MSGSRPQCLLILGGSHDQLFMIETAHSMGLETVVVDGNPKAPGLARSLHAASIDFSHIDEVKAYVQALRTSGVDVAGVCTMGSDVPHLLAEIGAAFGWEVPSRETARLATDKYEMKRAFQDAGVAVPAFALVASVDEVSRRWQEWRCERVVIKPTDGAGSRGVSVVDDQERLTEAFHHAVTNSKRGRVIAEEFLDGPQISTESIVFDDCIETPGYADRVYEGMASFLPKIMENGGWVPCGVTGSKRQDVIELVEGAARALGIERGVAKGDVVYHPVRGAVMIEMAARLSGGDFSESLVPLGTGVNYVRSAIEIALGHQPSWADLKPRWSKVVANRYFFTPPGLLEAVDGVEELRERGVLHKLDLWYKPGDRIPSIEHHGQRLGVFIVVGEERESAQRLIVEAYEKVRFRIDGRWVTGCPPGFLHGERSHHG